MQARRLKTTWTVEKIEDLTEMNIMEYEFLPAPHEFDGVGPNSEWEVLGIGSHMGGTPDKIKVSGSTISPASREPLVILNRSHTDIIATNGEVYWIGEPFNVVNLTLVDKGNIGVALKKWLAIPSNVELQPAGTTILSNAMINEIRAEIDRAIINDLLNCL